MKKFFVLSVVVLTVFVALAVKNTKASCPTDGGPWLSQIFEMTFGGCVWEVEVCYQCLPTSSASWVTIGNYSKKDPQCIPNIDPNDVPQLAKDAILANSLWLIGLCVTDIPPCGVDTWTVKLRDYSCWNVYRDFSDKIWYYICEFDSYCVTEVEYCWDPDEGPVKTGTPNVTYQVGTPDCPITDPGIPTKQGQGSGCWRLNQCY